MLATQLIGSPRGSRSRSDALGTYLLERLKERGVSINKVYFQQALSSEQCFDAVFRTIKEADLIPLVYPLYADDHHSGAVKAMELICGDPNNKHLSEKQMMVAISDADFPESLHNDLSLATSKRFAVGCGLRWARGPVLGGDWYIAGLTLEEAEGLVRNIRKPLKLADVDLAKGENAPADAGRLMAKPLMPEWVYLLVGHIGWLWKAGKQGCSKSLYDRPYLN